jgi:hypothetical protein
MPIDDPSSAMDSTASEMTSSDGIDRQISMSSDIQLDSDNSGYRRESRKRRVSAPFARLRPRGSIGERRPAERLSTYRVRPSILTPEAW